MDGQKLYRILFTALSAGIFLCLIWIIALLMQPVPRVEVFTNATLV